MVVWVYLPNPRNLSFLNDTCEDILGIGLKKVNLDNNCNDNKINSVLVGLVFHSCDDNTKVDIDRCDLIT